MKSQKWAEFMDYMIAYSWACHDLGKMKEAMEHSPCPIGEDDYERQAEVVEKALENVEMCVKELAGLRYWPSLWRRKPGDE